MENLTKAFLISLLMSGSFMVNAMDHESPEELARSLGLSHEEYLQQIHICTEVFAEPEDEITQTARSLGLSRKEYLDQQDIYQETYGSFSHQLVFQPQKEDTSGDLDYAFRLDKEDREERNRRAKERANKDCIRRLQERETKEAENLRLTHEFLALEEEQATFSHWTPNSIKDKIHAQTYEFSQNPAQHAVLEKFMGIFQHLKGIPQNADVHVLDNYVFGPTKAIASLLEVGRLYEAEEPILNLKQVGQQMVSFVNENKDFFDGYKYEETPLNSGTIIGYLNAHFGNMDNEIAICPEAREIWSRAWTLALDLYHKDHDMTAIQIIFDQAVEGHVTRGGCIQGRIDRGFVGYASLLCSAGVNLH